MTRSAGTQFDPNGRDPMMGKTPPVSPSTWMPSGGSAQSQPYTGAIGSGRTDQQAMSPFPGAAFYGTTNPFDPKAPLQDPGNNFTNPGYGEQALLATQNQLLNDPYAQQMQQLAGQAAGPSAGENYLNQNLGTLNGPGQGEQYWQGVQGQFMSPFAGEQFAHQATQNFSPTGAASAFYDQAMGQYDQFTGYSGPQNAQGAYGNAQSQLGNGTYGQQGLQQLAGQYGNIGQYNDPNLAAGQYEQTQQAFGDLPIANFDPFYDRARQLGVQSYNQGAAGRGVYGSSEALSGVGNVITDIEAQRANRSFDAEMQRAQEQRMRQQLLGEQARMGDLSSLAAFGANLSGVETFGNLNNQMGQLQNQSQSILGQMANNADSQALGAQQANIAGLNAFSNAASNADTAETNRYTASTNAMNQADRTAIDRLSTGADIADMADDNARDDYTASSSAATSAANVTNNRQQTAANIMDTGSDNDLNRLESFIGASGSAEGQRLARNALSLESTRQLSMDVQNRIAQGLGAVVGGSQEDFENWFASEIEPYLTDAEYDQQRKDSLRKDIGAAIGLYKAAKED